MSDIAMLVAEEYERRTKRFRKGEEAFPATKFHTVSFSSSSSSMDKIQVQKEEFMKRIWEPKTQIAIAASNSFFSA
ncbi:hypothetical protein LR48_Vigan03g303400 [Vigna angularis]|uniref:Uncharacterized protein n=2 Tax=Phaseolus angularis TaxID=3914 RepID=A0A0L9UAR9_PHAAN|nr:uncharacterized protein LOC128195609 [Vigna angularis]KAG2406762.1 uncharacterized protein HKW66_Vig0060190 [Vigna angularis]KOM39652.1 hypothetical protein LR48_Vigan03g303400 [Vigna angularis]BAT86499.1 hypothetical protein VIGAN_04415600 [Vigna angularis var. angularis]